MTDFAAANWPLLIIGGLALLAILAWLLVANRKTRVAIDRRDTLDEGAERAARNQALIDAAPAATRSGGVPIPPAVPEVVPAVIEQGDVQCDDLTRIKGLGPKLATTLHDLGITTFGQIAAWSGADIDRVDAQLGRFQGRIRRDAWVEQAKLLAAGDAAGFAARFGAQ